MAKIAIIDLMPFLYRGHFAFMRSPRMTSTGINTSALFGFANGIMSVLKDCEPDYAVLAMDPDGPTFRHEAYPQYKAQREKMPEDLAASIPMAFELADALNIPVLRMKGFEADDLMGTIAAHAAGSGFDVLLATPDKDAAQLVTDKIKLFRPGHGKDGPEIYDVEKVKEHWQLSSPAQMIDYLALAGDASDNIPGVRGVGEKTAVALLKDWGSVEEIIAHASELKGKLAEKVAAGAEDARASKFLTTIRTDVPMEIDLEAFRRREPDQAKLAAVCAKYELNQFAKRFGVASSSASPSAPAAAAPAEGDSQQPAKFDELADWPHEYRLVKTLAEAQELAKILEAAPKFAFDTETTGTDAHTASLVGMSFATEPGRAWYVAVRGASADTARQVRPQLDLFEFAASQDDEKAKEDESAARQIVACFAKAFADPKKTLVAQNAKYDITVLKRYGITFGSTVRDTMLEHYVLDAAARHGMDHMAMELLGYRPIPIERLIGEKERGKEQKNMSELAPEEILDYAAEDADVTLRLDAALRPRCEAAGLVPVLENSEEPLVDILSEMERDGVRIDPAALRRFGLELEKDILACAEAFRKAGGENVNLDSPKQLGEFLFDTLKLDPSLAKKTASGQYATDEKTLLKLESARPDLIETILEHRECTKLKSTYVDKLPKCIDPKDGRVHTTFAQAFTETGRLSSSNPNLQNIPVRTDRGKFVRAAIVPAEGNVLVSADYSQIELRIMAAMSGDESMLAAFAEGADIHRETAARVYGVMPDLVTPEQRSSCKMVNFGIIYGISAFGLSQRLRIPRREAAGLIETYFQEYPKIRAFMDRAIASAREKGYAETMTKRRRTLRDINSRNATARQAAERDAVNTPVQGTAADLMKLAMVRVARALKAEGLKARMVLQIHDELLFDTPPDEVERVIALAKREMSSAMDLGVPLEVGVGTGSNWLEAH